MKFVEHRIADHRALRLLRKCLEAGILQEGKWSDTEEGVSQGETAAWNEQRNASGARIRWLFDLERARQKLGRSYPHPAQAAPSSLPRAA